MILVALISLITGGLGHANFVTGEPISSTESVVAIDSVAIGAHRFKLAVVDDDGLESEPSFLDVIVTAGDRPTAVLDLVAEDGRRLEPNIKVGHRISLSARRSSDVAPGRIVEYRYTLIS